MGQREDFVREHKTIVVEIDGQQFTAVPKAFGTGSVGWNLNGKIVVDGIKCQLGLNITVIGSKEWE